MQRGYAIGFRHRLDLGPCIGFTYIESCGDGDWNEFYIELLLVSIIVIWE